MKRLPSLIRLALVGAGLTLLAPLDAAKADKPVPPPDVAVLTTELPAGTAPESVETALVQSFEAEQWTIAARAPGKVVAVRDQKTFNARVTASYDAARIQYFSDSWKVKSKSREKTKPAVPSTWIKKVNRAVRIQLGLSKPRKATPAA